MTVLKGPHRTHNGNGHVENGVVREDIRKPEVLRALPPFNRLPVRAGVFS